MVLETMTQNIAITALHNVGYQHPSLSHDEKSVSVFSGLHLRLLGDFLLSSGNEPVTSIDLPRMQSLLTYLVLHHEAPQERSHVAFLFWPNSTDAQALGNLRTLVHRLRHALPDADNLFRVDRQGIWWRPNVPWTLDVLEFERAVAQAEQSVDFMMERQALERAVAFYRGDLLPGCYDEWVLPERDRLRQLFLAALQRLISVLEQERDYRAAIRASQHLLRHDPLHEETYRRLMRFYAVNGDRSSALRVYQTCTDVLERELNVEPGRATRQVYERLMQW